MDMETLQPGTNSTRASSGIVPDPGMSFEMTVYYDDDDDNKMDDTILQGGGGCIGHQRMMGKKILIPLGKPIHRNQLDGTTKLR